MLAELEILYQQLVAKISRRYFKYGFGPISNIVTSTPVPASNYINSSYKTASSSVDNGFTTGDGMEGFASSGQLTTPLPFFVPKLANDFVFVMFATYCKVNSATLGSTFTLRYGTGAAPGAGVAPTGTAIVNKAITSAATNMNIELVLAGIISGLTTGGNGYWFDIEAANGGDGTNAWTFPGGANLTIIEFGA